MSLARSLWSMISRHPQASPSQGDDANSAPLKDNMKKNKTGNKMLQPKVFLDVANLIEGEGTSLEASLKVLHHHLPLIDHCCQHTWGCEPNARYAYSLSSIHPQVHEQLTAAGYQLSVAGADQSETRLMERASKLDDYELKREVKALVQQGARELLVVSGDRDFESLATELSVFGVQCYFVQRQAMTPYKSSSFVRYKHLEQFSQPLKRAPSQTTPEININTRGSTPPQGAPRVTLEREGRVIEELALISGFKVGRSSSRLGPVELCLSRFDREKTYSRQLLQLHQLGEAWVLWRSPQDEVDLARQPLLYTPSSPSRPSFHVGSGEGVALQDGDTLSFERCGLRVRFEGV